MFPPRDFMCLYGLSVIIQARRDLERELMDHQSKQADPEVERRLKKKVQKYKAVLMDLQDELEHERDMRGNSAILKSLRNQLEDLQASETTAVKAQKRLQGEVDDLQVQTDELSRAKMEVCFCVWSVGEGPDTISQA